MSKTPLPSNKISVNIDMLTNSSVSIKGGFKKVLQRKTSKKKIQFVQRNKEQNLNFRYISPKSTAIEKQQLDYKFYTQNRNTAFKNSQRSSECLQFQSIKINEDKNTVSPNIKNSNTNINNFFKDVKGKNTAKSTQTGIQNIKNQLQCSNLLNLQLQSKLKKYSIQLQEKNKQITGLNQELRNQQQNTVQKNLQLRRLQKCIKKLSQRIQFFEKSSMDDKLNFKNKTKSQRFDTCSRTLHLKQNLQSNEQNQMILHLMEEVKYQQIQIDMLKKCRIQFMKDLQLYHKTIKENKNLKALCDFLKIKQAKLQKKLVEKKSFQDSVCLSLSTEQRSSVCEQSINHQGFIKKQFVDMFKNK